MMTRTELDLTRDRIADAIPLSRVLLDRLAIAACEQDPAPVGGTLDDIRRLIEGLAAEAEHVLNEYETARRRIGTDASPAAPPAALTLRAEVAA